MKHAAVLNDARPRALTLKKRYFFAVRLLLLLSIVGGCASQEATRGSLPTARVIQVPRVVITAGDDTPVTELFARAESKARAGDLTGAAALFDRVAAREPNGELAAEALFRAAEAHDLSAEHEAAVSRYRAVADRYPAHVRARAATLRSVRLLTYLEDWQWAGRYADRMLEHASELAPLESVVAYGGKALSLVAAGDDVRAASFIERGRDVIERHSLDLAGRLPRDVAPLYYALGEVQRVRSERIRFTPTPPNFLAVLEQRCQLILDAQRAYSDSWRAYDAHWSTLAGYRLGEMYAKLHAELVAIPPPVTADTDARRQLFEGAMRLRYSVLLEKARGMLEHTVTMAEREGERSAAVVDAKQALNEIRAAEEAEQAALGKLPYSRAVLEEVLADLQKKAREAAKDPKATRQTSPGTAR
jgi:hypothetical protein